jgi:hypothetical protein
MPQSTLPKSDRPEDWEKAADSVKKEHDDYVNERWLGIGPKKSRSSPQEKGLIQAYKEAERMRRETAKRLRKAQTKSMSK